jgi:hypothetical protein
VSRSGVEEIPLEPVDGLEQFAGQPLSEAGEVVADLGDRRVPAFHVDREDGREVVVGDIESVSVERARCGQPADRGVDGLGAAVDPLDNPLEYP